MNKAGIPEKDNPFTTIGLFAILIENILRMEKRIDVLERQEKMNSPGIDQELICQCIRRMLKERAESGRKIGSV
jgi:hypothetical protein